LGHTNLCGQNGGYRQGKNGLHEAYLASRSS
jgi:hypothetical protein